MIGYSLDILTMYLKPNYKEAFIILETFCILWLNSVGPKFANLCCHDSSVLFE